jgi:hypothetical protein
MIALLFRAPRNFRRCAQNRDRDRDHIYNNGHSIRLTRGEAFSAEDAEMAMVESSLRNMMAGMTTMMMGNQQNWAGNRGVNMDSGDRREYIANVLVTKVSSENLKRYCMQLCNWIFSNLCFVLLMLLQRVVINPPGDINSPLEQAAQAPDSSKDCSKGDLLITAPFANDEGESHAMGMDIIDNEDQDQCAICLVPYEAGDKKCTHAFHRKCIIDWLIAHDECPICRHNYLSLDDDDDDENDEQGGGAANNEERNRVRSVIPAPIPIVPAVRNEEDQLVRGLQLLFEFSMVPNNYSYNNSRQNVLQTMASSDVEGSSPGVGTSTRSRIERIDTPPADDPPGIIIEQITPYGQAAVADVGTEMASPTLGRTGVEANETLVHEAQTAVSPEPEQAVRESSSEVNEVSGGSVVPISHVPPAASEQSVSGPVELETSAGESEARVHDSP